MLELTFTRHAWITTLFLALLASMSALACGDSMRASRTADAGADNGGGTADGGAAIDAPFDPTCQTVDPACVVELGTSFDNDRTLGRGLHVGCSIPADVTRLHWTAPAAADVRFAAFGGVGTTLELLDVCTGESLGSDTVDDQRDLPQASVFRALSGGQDVVIEVSNVDSGTSFFLELRTLQPEVACGDGLDDDGDGRADCADLDCATAEACRLETCYEIDLASELGAPAITGSTRDQTNDFAGSCGGQDRPDRSFLWTAPAAGRYRFDPAGSAYNYLVYLIDGVDCSGDELACANRTAPAVVDLAAGQSVVVVMDGSGLGDFGISIVNETEAGSAD